jgi:hypothetical protein
VYSQTSDPVQNSESILNPYYNLPPEQNRIQRLVEQYNADARLWKKLAPAGGRAEICYGAGSPRRS